MTPGYVPGMDDPQDTQPAAEPLRASQPNSAGDQTASGGMGVSSERVGPTGDGQVATDGMKDTSLVPPEALPDDAPPEQAAGSPEDNPEGLPPKAGYSSVDPRSDDQP